MQSNSDPLDEIASPTGGPASTIHDEELEFPSSITKGYQRLPFFDKQWVIAQGLASFGRFLFFVTAVRGYFKYDYRDCDERNPFQDAAIVSLPIWIFGDGLWLVTNEFRQCSKKLNASDLWTQEGRRRRRVRVPWLFFASACLQCIVALVCGLSAYRTSRGDLGFGALPVAGSVAAITSPLAALYNLFQAASSYQARHRDTMVLPPEKQPPNQNQTQLLPLELHKEIPETSFFFTITLSDIHALPTFNRYWLFLRAATFASLLCLLPTSSILLWTAPCGSAERKLILKASQQSFRYLGSYPTFTAFAIPGLRFLAGGKRPTRNVLHWLLPIASFTFVLSSWIMYDIVLNSDLTSYGALVVRTQGVVVATITLLSGLYDIALLLKATFGAAARPKRIEDHTGKSDEKARLVGPGGYINDQKKKASSPDNSITTSLTPVPP